MITNQCAHCLRFGCTNNCHTYKNALYSSNTVEINHPKEGTKFDQGKAPLELLDHKSMEKIAKVFDFGAKKYGRFNYKAGLKWSRLIGAAYRHLGAFNSGEDTDPESGHPHLAHLGCCIFMLLEAMEQHKNLDDRYKLSSDTSDQASHDKVLSDK